MNQTPWEQRRGQWVCYQECKQCYLVGEARVEEGCPVCASAEWALGDIDETV